MTMIISRLRLPVATGPNTTINMMTTATRRESGGHTMSVLTTNTIPSSKLISKNKLFPMSTKAKRLLRAKSITLLLTTCQRKRTSLITKIVTSITLSETSKKSQMPWALLPSFLIKTIRLLKICF